MSELFSWEHVLKEIVLSTHPPSWMDHGWRGPPVQTPEAIQLVCVLTGRSVARRVILVTQDHHNSHTSPAETELREAKVGTLVISSCAVFILAFFPAQRGEASIDVGSR